jgi:hypothetical protein
MDAKTKKIVQEIDFVIQEYDTWKKPLVGKTIHDWDVPRFDLYAFFTTITDTIFRFAPSNSQYCNTVKKIFSETDINSFNGLNASTKACYSILIALRNAFVRGALDNMNEQINANLFEDFLEMAESFLEKGDQYKHPAAFLIGGVLEEHLRKLAIKNDIPIKKDNEKYRQAADLNTDLRKKDVYDLNEQQSITSWLGLRNEADHAHWNNYTQDKVEVMLKDVRRLIKQYPA